MRVAYPVQTAERKPSQVGPGNRSAFKRTENVLHTVTGLDYSFPVGGYHSHPNGSVCLSEDDIEYIWSEFDILDMEDKTMLEPDRWLEIVVSIRKKKYKNDYHLGGRWHLRGNRIYSTITIKPRVGYHLTMAGWWLLDPEQVTMGDVVREGGEIEMEWEARLFFDVKSLQ